MYYVQIKRVNGRNHFYHLAKMIAERGYGDNVEYSPGNGDVYRGHVLPHLRFLDEQDALAYCLTYGGTIRKSVPTSECGEEC